MKKSLAVVAVLVLALFAVFVWPTRWRYEQTGRSLVRFDRFSGEVQQLRTSGWVAIRPVTMPSPCPPGPREVRVKDPKNEFSGAFDDILCIETR